MVKARWMGRSTALGTSWGATVHVGVVSLAGGTEGVERRGSRDDGVGSTVSHWSTIEQP